MNILIGVPSPAFHTPSFTHNLLEIVSYTKSKLPNVIIDFDYQQGVRTDRNRNQILNRALERGGVDYILWLDSDMIFPADIIEKFLQANKEVIGCLYFKRSAPHQPIGYVKSDDPDRPYRPIRPDQIKEKGWYKVDGLGYGGMLVKMSVYEKLGDKKWTNYGDEFHNPNSKGLDSVSHDLRFCIDCQSVGIDIYLHSEVRPAHIGEIEVTEKDWYRCYRDRIVVIMPHIDWQLANKTAKLLRERSGITDEADVEWMIVEDTEKSGFIATANYAFNKCYGDYYIYLAQDVFPGLNWLKTAYDTIKREKKNLLAFNAGRWHDRLASFGMVSRGFLEEVYQDKLFCDEYHSHYADVELTLIAKEMNQFVYEPKAVLMELDERMIKPAKEEDLVVFNKRRKENFGGLVNSKYLLNYFNFKDD